MENKEIEKYYQEFVALIKQRYESEQDPVKKQAIKKLIDELNK